MGAWQTIVEMLLREERQYRGDTFVTYAELTKLFVGSEKRPGITGRRPDPRGGVADGDYQFDPSILALGDSPQGNVLAWSDDPDTALARATTASSKEIGAGLGTGGTMVKATHGGSGAMMQMAPKQPYHNDRLGSSMDRYDVLLVADIGQAMNRRGTMVTVARIKRVAWAPSMGSQEERAQRLRSLLAGQQVQLPRRPQPERPGT